MNAEMWRDIFEMIAERVLDEFHPTSERSAPSEAEAIAAETATLRLEVSSLSERLSTCERLLTLVASNVRYLFDQQPAPAGEPASASEPEAAVPEPEEAPSAPPSTETTSPSDDFWTRLSDAIDVGGHWRALDLIVITLKDAGIEETEARAWLGARAWLFSRPRGRFADAGAIIRDRLKSSPGFDFMVALLVGDDRVWSETWNKFGKPNGESSNN